MSHPASWLRLSARRPERCVECGARDARRCWSETTRGRVIDTRLCIGCIGQSRAARRLVFIIEPDGA